MADGIMLIGPSGAGKSTLARELYHQAHLLYKTRIVLDADEIRPFWKELGFSQEDVNDNVSRLGRLGGVIAQQIVDGLVIITCIAPYREGREVAYRGLKDNCDNCALVYLDTGLDKRESRDPKGLYKAAKEGKIPNLAGYNAPYDAPNTADIILHQEDKNVSELATELLEQFRYRMLNVDRTTNILDIKTC